MTKGQVFTPEPIADRMVEKLFRKKEPEPTDRVLDPGCGTGIFIERILSWCERKEIEPPQIVGVELDTNLIDKARESVGGKDNVDLINCDFLLKDFERFDYIIGNPPYVPIEELDESEKEEFREKFETAVNRFDLSSLFFEKALGLLDTNGRLVFISPEKYEYTLTTSPLRELMAKYRIKEIHHLDEDTFEGLVTYPAIITIDGREKTTIRRRDGKTVRAELPPDGSRWISKINGFGNWIESEIVLDDISKRISCGVATGRDKIFVKDQNEIPDAIKKYARPTISGKELTEKGANASQFMIVPYDEKGDLLSKNDLDSFLNWASTYKDELSSRHCVIEDGKEWYSFHEDPPLQDILSPKILCKDVTNEPEFWMDEGGAIIPRHSVYYIVPKDTDILPALLKYLNSEKAQKWLTAHCQRAANDFIRLQSNVLKQLPVPNDIQKGTIDE
ncbi:hypothetical protein AKJ62_01985 [candidate division MSBL1 archaeon SCGC-AAA259D14]|uniref:site-specific DNA-methyltransferase (adenine-specific) n=1 Tax=candidate division MSBL1 archaeon SCGC-AAA259D14 TaxID=1698261 RepID=A0A133U704_9EURY|nr:hypothetical protein AKJ62_01985 [candidate division MSBL1 archaeon SCGC-AAA259D14]